MKGAIRMVNLRHPQQEEWDLRQLPPSNQQAPGKVIVHAIVFSQTIFSLFSISVRKKDCCSQTNPDFVCLMILHYVHMKQSVANKAATTWPICVLVELTNTLSEAKIQIILLIERRVALSSTSINHPNMHQTTSNIHWLWWGGKQD